MKRWMETQLDVLCATILFAVWCVVHKTQLRDEITLECAIRVVQRARERLTTGGYTWFVDTETGERMSPMVGDYDGGDPHPIDGQGIDAQPSDAAAAE